MKARRLISGKRGEQTDIDLEDFKVLYAQIRDIAEQGVQRSCDGLRHQQQ